MEGCNTGDALYVGDLAGVAKFFDQGIEGILSDIANAIMKAAVDLFAGLADVPTLGADKDARDQIHENIQLQTNWLVVTIAVASLLAAAFRMALERRHQPGVEAAKGLVRMVLTVGAAWTVITWLAAEADAYSSHLYEQGIKRQLETIAQCGTDGLTAFLLIVIGLLLLLAGCVHVILMYVRLGIMTLLAGTLPLAAAASMTEWGGGWWRKHIAWMVAWLAFKPVVGLIFYAGAAMLGNGGMTNQDFKLAGAGVLLLAAVALPALMRLVVPAMATLGAKDPVAPTVAAGAAAVGGLARGASMVAGGGAGGGAGRGAAPSGGRSSAGSGSGGGSGGSGGSGGRPSTTRRMVGAAASTVQRTARVAGSATRYAANAADSTMPSKDDQA